MNWKPETALNDFAKVAALAGVTLSDGDIELELLSAPHTPPSRLPTGKMAVYVFSRGGDALKVGKVGPKSQARYTSQHYNPRSAMSTLAASILADRDTLNFAEIDERNVGEWIKNNVDRVNFLLDEGFGIHVLTLLESFLQCRLKPRYEGFKSQRR